MASQIDGFEVTDTTTDRFTLSRPPAPGSLNVSLNGYRLGRRDHVLDGQDLVILDPVKTFRGVESQAPWDLEVQYDVAAPGITAPV